MTSANHEHDTVMPKWLTLLATQGPESWSNGDLTSAQNSGNEGWQHKITDSSALIQVYTRKQQGRTFITWFKATVRFHLIEWFVDVLMSFQVLPTTPHNVEFLLIILGHELTDCQISKLIHLHTTREVHIHTARFPDFQPGRQQGKEPGSHLVNTNRESCVLPKSTLYHSWHGMPSNWLVSTLNTFDSESWDKNIGETRVFERPNNTKEARVQPQKQRTQDKREDTESDTASWYISG